MVGASSQRHYVMPPVLPQASRSKGRGHEGRAALGAPTCSSQATGKHLDAAGSPHLHQHADDALDAVADEGAAKLVALLLQGGAASTSSGSQALQLPAQHPTKAACTEQI